LIDPEARALIEHLKLTRLGFEGGFFREEVRSDLDLSAEVLSSSYGGPRSLHTAIFYLLTDGARSLMHRLRGDEVYHFYRGDPVELLCLGPKGAVHRVVLGPDILAGHRPQYRVPAGVWQGSRVIPGGRYALMGTTMSPGFDLRDFELGDRETLRAQYPAPEHADLLTALTPARLRTESLELTAADLDLLHAERTGVDRLAAGLGASAPAQWPPPGAAPLDGAERSEARGWSRWYVVCRSERKLVGVAGFGGPPSGGCVHLVAPAWTSEVADPAAWSVQVWCRLAAHAGVDRLRVEGAPSDLELPGFERVQGEYRSRR
jgi:uncharacterized protein